MKIYGILKAQLLRNGCYVRLPNALRREMHLEKGDRFEVILSTDGQTIKLRRLIPDDASVSDLLDQEPEKSIPCITPAHDSSLWQRMAQMVGGMRRV